MPITVRHDPSATGGIATLAALAGSLAAGGRAPVGGGGGRRGGSVSIKGKTTMMPRGPIRPGGPTLEEQLRLKMEFEEKAKRFGLETEMERMREDAKLEAERWEARYTAKDRQEIARLNEGKKRLAQNPNFSEWERTEATKAIDMQIAGIEPSLIPRDPDKPTYPEGKGPQDQWVNENSGALVGLDRSGNPRVLVQPDKMPEALKAKAQIEREKDLAASRLKLMMESVKDDEGVERPKYRDIQIESMLESTYPWYRQQQIQRQQAEMQDAANQRIQAEEAAVQGRAENVWWSEAERTGINIQEIDKSLPPEVGLAQAYLRQYPEYENVPDDMRQAWLEAFKNYSNALNAQQGAGAGGVGL